MQLWTDRVVVRKCVTDQLAWRWKSLSIRGLMGFFYQPKVSWESDWHHLWGTELEAGHAVWVSGTHWYLPRLPLRRVNPVMKNNSLPLLRILPRRKNFPEKWSGPVLLVEMLSCPSKRSREWSANVFPNSDWGAAVGEVWIKTLGGAEKVALGQGELGSEMSTSLINMFLIWQSYIYIWFGIF